MNAAAAWYVITIFIIVINCTSMFLSFPSRYRLRYSVAMVILFAAAFYAVTHATKTPSASFGGVRGLVFLFLFSWILVGGFFQKLFAFFLPHLLLMWLFALIEAVLKLVMEHGTGAYYTALTTITLTAYAGYMVFLLKYGRRLLRHFFEMGRPVEWAVYSLGALFSFFLMMLLRFTDIGPVPYILLLLFILWSFSVLCYASINAHEKYQKSYEADFSQSVISAGHDHYQKMNDLYKALSVMRHDYKYHLNTIGELLNNGDTAEIKRYLSDAQARLPNGDLRNYCKNSVLNALLGSYAERCEKEDIGFTVQLSMPETPAITNYDMCIVLGNLLENAVEACIKLRQDAKIEIPGHSNTEHTGKIELAAKTQGAYLAIMVKNDFTGTITQTNGQPISTKKSGGLGLRSVRAVAARYDGHMLTEWDTDTFTAYVMLRMQEEITP